MYAMKSKNRRKNMPNPKSAVPAVNKESIPAPSATPNPAAAAQDSEKKGKGYGSKIHFMHPRQLRSELVRHSKLERWPRIEQIEAIALLIIFDSASTKDKQPIRTKKTHAERHAAKIQAQQKQKDDAKLTTAGDGEAQVS
jgi:hypothetical protein